VIAYTIGRSDFQRTTEQPGTVEAFEWVDVAPKLSGYLTHLNVDIGDSVKRGQVLAEIQAPELVAEQRKAQALVEHANAKVVTAKAAVMVAQASLEAAKAKAEAVSAGLGGAESSLRYREQMLKRLKSLAARNAVEHHLVDEAEGNVEVAKSSLAEAKAQMVAARASIQEAMAKLVTAKSDVGEAEANLHIAHAELERALAMTSYTKIVSPWDGIVTRRDSHAGNFVRSGEMGGSAPLFTLMKTGKVRVVVHVPEVDAPYLDNGDRATVRMDSLRGRVYSGVVARTALAEDPKARTVRAEIDLDNSDGRLRPGQYGRVTINLQDRRNILSIPASALIEQAADRTAACYRIVDGRAVRTRIKIGEDYDDRVEVVEGLKEGDSVVTDPNRGITDGQSVSIKQVTSTKKD
jgi:RND family efflux transporter MFP subunit